MILAHIAGRLRRHHIKILPGDRVDVELSPDDLTKGRIVYRYRAGEARRSVGSRNLLRSLVFYVTVTGFDLRFTFQVLASRIQRLIYN